MIKTFPAVVKNGKGKINLSYGSATQKDADGNEVTVYVWVNGNWKVEYKGKEYIISLNDNVTALVDAINESEGS